MAKGSYHEPYEEVTDKVKKDFLDLVAQGYTRQEASAALGWSGRPFRALCSPKSFRYDKEFHDAYAKLTEKDGEYHQALAERMEAIAVRRAETSSDRLLEKLLIIYHPAWKQFQPQQMQVNFNADKMQMLFPGLSTETLEQMRQELEEKRTMRELMPATDDDIIDVEPAA